MGRELPAIQPLRHVLCSARRPAELVPVCPNRNYRSAYINQHYKDLKSRFPQELLDRVVMVLEKMPEEKRRWYDASGHLQPIKKDLQRVLNGTQNGAHSGRMPGLSD